MGNVESYRILVLGDFHSEKGDSRAGTGSLAGSGYGHSTGSLRSFIDVCDFFILNLETSVLDPETSRALASERQTNGAHSADRNASGSALKELGVDVVNLANNHVLDHGVEDLESIFQTLSDAGIGWFGAGRTLAEARTPYRLRLPPRVGGGEIHLHGSFRYSNRNERNFGFHADHASPGLAPLVFSAVPNGRGASAPEDSFQVAFPHWGAEYEWRDRGQYRLAHRFLNKDYDLVLGHGSHAMQEVHRKQQRWIVYSIGNGIFRSDGLRQQYEEEGGILPYSLWAVLEVHRQDDRRWVMLKLYPVYPDNTVTGFQSGPVSSVDFNRVMAALSARPVRPWRFNNPAQTTGTDDLGHFLALDLGRWEEGERPARLESPTADGDPGEWPLRSPGVEIEDTVLSLGRSMGAVALVMSAQADGASIHWLTWHLALVECRGKRILVQDYRAHESSLGAAIADDKALTAELLENAGVPTPKTIVVGSAEAAVDAAATLAGAAVVKPSDGKKSRGVSTGLVNSDEIREAFAIAGEHGSRIIVQEHIAPEQELRVMASPDQAVAVIGRVLPHVTGDGLSTIGQLIEDKNQQRTLNPSLRKRPIPVDELTHRQLAREGFSLHAVPEVGQVVTVRNVAGLSVGADAFQAQEVAEPRIKEAAMGAVRAIPGLGWGGVDLIIEKNTGTPYVVEINTKAAYGAAVFPAYGVPRDVGAEVWKLRYAATAPEPGSTPELPEPTTGVFSIISGTDLAPHDVITFSRLLEESLARQNYTIEPRNCHVLHVTAPDGARTWITRTGLTAKDRDVVRVTMKRHEWVSELLGLRGVPKVRSRPVTSIRRLARFVEGRYRRVILTPVSAPWNGPDSHVLTDQEALAMTALPGKMWLQARPAGRRVRVMATRDRAWVITANGRPRPLAEDLAAAVGQLAVDAVRAIPELRWAAVDVLVRPRRIRGGRPNGAMVEGLTIKPEYTDKTHILSGDFDGFFRDLVEPPGD